LVDDMITLRRVSDDDKNKANREANAKRDVPSIEFVAGQPRSIFYFLDRIPSTEYLSTFIFY
jgi:hypothetical protein